MRLLVVLELPVPGPFLELDADQRSDLHPQLSS
jgi:hypothetical protein